jgi:hypothetical protein
MKCEDCFIPKHHIFWHMISRMQWQGNPTWYSTWQNEADNRILKDACRTTSQATFEGSVLTRMRDLMMSADRKRKA